MQVCMDAAPPPLLLLLLILTAASLIQDAEDRVVSGGALNVLQNLVHAGGLGAAGQNHPVLVLGADHLPAEAFTSCTGNDVGGIQTTDLRRIEHVKKLRLDDVTEMNRFPVSHLFNLNFDLGALA